LTEEHFSYSHLVALSVITRHIHLILKYEYVPDALGYSITIPLAEDSSSKTQCDSRKYRGITVSPIIFKTFEYVCFKNFNRIWVERRWNSFFKKEWVQIMLFFRYAKW